MIFPGKYFIRTFPPLRRGIISNFNEHKGGPTIFLLLPWRIKNLTESLIPFLQDTPRAKNDNSLRIKWQILLQINIFLVLNCPSFIRIKTSFVEHVVFLFLHLFDNCCNWLLRNRANRVSEFTAI